METSWDNRTLIRIGEARLVGWSRQMLYSGFITLPRSGCRSADLNGRSDNLDVIPLKQNVQSRSNMNLLTRLVSMRFGTRTILVAIGFAALFVYFVIVADVHRTDTIQHLRDEGVVVHAPMVVMFGGPQPVPHATPEPMWHAFRQRLNNLIGIETVPWYSDGYLEIPPGLDAIIVGLIDDLEDLKALRKWDGPEREPQIDFPGNAG